MRVAALTGFFAALQEGERIEFVHRLSTGIDGAAAYAFNVSIAGHRLRRDALAVTTASVLANACPSYCFAPIAPGDRLKTSGVADNVPASQGDAYRHRALIAPAGLKVREKPLPSHIAPQPYSRLSWEKGNGEPRTGELPCPEDCPTWAFTEPLLELPNLPGEVEFRIVVEGFSLSDCAQAQLHGLLTRVESGSLSVFHPLSPITAYSLAHELREPAVSLARHWLRHPKGYTAVCLVSSSGEFDSASLSRVAANVFGKRPTQTLRLAVGPGGSLARSGFAHALCPAQGVPGMLPGLSVLPMLGVARHFARPLDTPPQTGAWLGSSLCGYHATPVRLPNESRSRHVMLVGGSGTGKSSMLLQMIQQDINDPTRRTGCALLDPHGDLTDRVLSLVPSHRIGDVMLVDVGDPVSTVSLNPLQGMRDDPVLAQFIVNEIMSLIDMLFEGSDTSGPMLRSHLRHLLLLAAYAPQRHGTFLDAMRILEDADYREYLLGNCPDRTLVDYWKRFSKSTGTDNGFATWLPYLMARLTPFTANPVMKRLICRPDSSIDLALAMSEGQIVLIRLRKAILQDAEVQVLGALIMARFFAAALGRARIPEAMRAPFHLYVDEAQSFVTDSFPRMLSESRKYQLCITTANQNIGQMRGTGRRAQIVDSLLANTATKFLFRLGPADQETLQPYYKPAFDAGLMATLPDFTAVACMSKSHCPIPAFAMRVTTPAAHEPDPAMIQRIVANSREQYGMLIATANRELCTLFNLDAASLGSGYAAPSSLPPKP